MALYNFKNNEFTLAEQYMYGSARLGVTNRGILIDTPADTMNYVTVYNTLGEKQYELANHLGNVLVTVSDKKVVEPNGSMTEVAYYYADVSSANDYYPFGMQMPGRNGSAGEYRYGFNGMEKDDEVKGNGNSLDFGARIYDSRIGRWLSPDPLEVKYPFLTPYSGMNNNPILYLDSYGKEFILTIIGNTENGINQFNCFLETETNGEIQARIAEEHADGSYTVEFFNSSGQKITLDNIENQNFSSVKTKVLANTLVKVQDDERPINYVQTPAKAGTLVGSYNEKNPQTKTIAQLFDLWDMVQIEKLTDGKVSASALLAHEIIEGFMGQTTGENYSDHHNNYGLTTQANADGFSLVTMQANDDYSRAIITTVEQFMEPDNSLTTITTTYTLKIKSGNPISLVDKKVDKTNVSAGPLIQTKE